MILREHLDVGKGYRARAVGGLRQTDHTYFSVTLESWVLGREDTSGADHETILRLWPDLKPLVDLHLSNVNGVPMYAEANGWYWLAGALGGLGEEYHGGQDYSESECLLTLKNHLRILDANQLLGDVAQAYAELGATEARLVFKQFVEDQKDRWKQEAEAAIAMFNLKEEV